VGLHGEQLEKNVGQREVLREQFDGWPEGRKQPCFLGGRRNPSLLPLDQTLTRPQAPAAGSPLSLLYSFSKLQFPNNALTVAVPPAGKSRSCRRRSRSISIRRDSKTHSRSSGFTFAPPSMFLLPLL